MVSKGCLIGIIHLNLPKSAFFDQLNPVPQPGSQPDSSLISTRMEMLQHQFTEKLSPITKKGSNLH